jgi:hypothetical protein
MKWNQKYKHQDLQALSTKFFSPHNSTTKKKFYFKL